MAGGAARDATSAGTGIAASADRIVLLVALAFAVFVIVSLAYFTFLPAYSEGRPGLFLMHPGAIVLFVPLGNLTATLLVARLSGGGVARLSIAAFALCAIAGLVLFQAEDSLAATLAGILLSVGLGIVASAVYAMIPFVVPRGGSAVIVIGLVSQAGGLATLAGPPVAGFIVDRSGWPMLGVFIAATSVLGMAALWPGRNVARL
jgi:predicted MFS family arabinose efflux permease